MHYWNPKDGDRVVRFINDELWAGTIRQADSSGKWIVIWDKQEKRPDDGTMVNVRSFPFSWSVGASCLILPERPASC